MNSRNPYDSPSANFNAETEEQYQPTVFSFSGRIGRLRYIAYAIPWALIMMVAMAIFGIISAVLIPTMGDSGTGLVIFILLYVALSVISLIPTFTLARRRFNDLNQSGWLSLLILVPFVNVLVLLFLIFAPGTKGVNKYGPMPVKNSTLVIIGALVLPIGFVVFTGILAAVALPAYQDYVLRSQAIEAFNASHDIQARVETYYLEYDQMPAQNQDINHTYRNNSPYIESIDIRTGGIITVVLSSDNLNLDQKTVVFTPSTEQGYVEWDCTGGDLDDRYRPSLCRQ